MSDLEQRMDVACPLAQAAARLADFFRANGNADGDALKLDLRLDVHVPGLPAPLVLQRPVIATIESHHRIADMTPRYAVRWAPEKPGPFPRFSGELLVEGGDDYDTFTLRLSGKYEPPLGLVGKGFDILFGNRIANATATNLLGRLKEIVERKYRLDEAQKQRPKSAAEHV